MRSVKYFTVYKRGRLQGFLLEGEQEGYYVTRTGVYAFVIEEIALVVCLALSSNKDLPGLCSRS